MMKTFRRLCCAVCAAAMILPMFLLSSPAALAATLATTDPDNVTVTKTARVNGGSWDAGTSENPVTVSVGDTIEYKIDFNIPCTSNPPYVGYDILFLVDWSSSMNYPYGTGQSGTVLTQTRESMMKLCELIKENFPQSRVAAMGMSNKNKNNMDDPSDLYVQYDKGFAPIEDYAATIGTAFTGTPLYSEDDNAQFFKKAYEKLEARDDKVRVPVIIHISDFQIYEKTPTDPLPSELNPVYNQLSYYWRDHFQPKVDQYYATYPNGILITVRCDKDGASSYFSNAAADGWMNSYIIKPSERTNWRFVKFTKNQSNDARTALLWDTLSSALHTHKATLTDQLPSGITYVSATGSVDPVYSSANHTVTWNYSVPHGGGNHSFSVTVTGTVSEYGTFENKATAAVTDFTTRTSDSTWHRASNNVLVTEEFRELGNRSNLLQNDVTTPLAPGSSFSSVPPARFDEGGKVYLYYGWQVDLGAVNVGAAPAVILSGVTSNRTVTWVYRTSYTIEIAYHDIESPFSTLKSSETKQVMSGDSYAPVQDANAAQTIVYNGQSFQFSGQYRIDNDQADLIPASVDVNSIHQDMTIILTYNHVPQYRLYIRMVVIGRSGSSLPLPDRGHYTVSCPFSSVNLSSACGASSDTPYSEYVLVPDYDGMIMFIVSAIIPQRYDYAGYVATDADVPHNASGRQTGAAVLTYGSAETCYLTIYIKPGASSSGAESVEVINDFGTMR